MEYVVYILAGMFAFNSIPHLVSGISGKKHMTPLGKDSSATLNVLWGFLNMAVSILLLNFTQSGIRFPSAMDTVAVFCLAVLSCL